MTPLEIAQSGVIITLLVAAKGLEPLTLRV